MFAVIVTFEIKAGKMAAFLPAMEENARLSRQTEPGCRQFDVCTDAARPDEVFLYELYDTAAAFQAHLGSAHFRSFEQATAPMIARKDVRTYAQVSA